MVEELLISCCRGDVCGRGAPNVLLLESCVW